MGRVHLHAEQREDGHQQEHEDAEVGDLRYRLAKRHHDFVQTRPRLSHALARAATK